jgi:hypothetical protein
MGAVACRAWPLAAGGLNLPIHGVFRRTNPTRHSETTKMLIDELCVLVDNSFCRESRPSRVTAHLSFSYHMRNSLTCSTQGTLEPPCKCPRLQPTAEPTPLDLA